MEIKEALDILELDEHYTEESLKQHFRDLISVWHPDRYQHNHRLQIKALEKTKQLNSAYEVLKKSINECHFQRNNYSEAQNNPDIILIKCPFCLVLNRVPQNIDQNSIKCGCCGKFFKSYQEAPGRSETDTRRPCGDESCTGTIGSNGHCNYCGKTYKEGRNKTFQEEKRWSERSNESSHRTSKKKKYIYFAVIGIAVVAINYFANTPDNKPTKPIPKAEIDVKATNPKSIDLQISIKEASSKEDAEIDYQNLNEIYGKHLASDNRLDRNQIKAIQYVLSVLGYEIGPVDGIPGNRTIDALRQYSIDFGFNPTVNFPNDFFDDIEPHIDISSVHADWKDIYIGNEFEMWINSKTKDFKNEVVSQGINNPKVLIHLVRLFKFEKLNPAPLPLPPTDVLNKIFQEGSAPLEILTKQKDINYLIKVVKAENDEEILSAFIRGGEHFETEIPLGRYKIKTASGSIWYGLSFHFGPTTSYSIADEIFEFTRKGDQVSGYTIELYLQRGGNLDTKTITGFQF